MDAVFISSIQTGFEDVRAAARRAIESLGHRALMAELVGARIESPQRALLDLVAAADTVLLLVGPRYSKPTEEEFEEARRLSRPILVLKQDADLEPPQAEFLERVAGGWVGGRMWGVFKDAGDVGFAVVKAISGMSAEQREESVGPRARARARELAEGSQSGFSARGSLARIAFVPLIDDQLLDALALDDRQLGDDIADIARSARLVPHSVGITPQITRGGVWLHRAGTSLSGLPAPVAVHADGCVVSEFDIGGDDQLAGTRVDPDLLGQGITQAGRFALSTWERIDSREQVQQIAVALAIPEAQHKVFGLPVGASSYSMGWNLPATIVVPEPAAIIRRADASGEQLARRLVAEVRRAFADSGIQG